MQHLSQNPTEPGFVQDPYPFYDRARQSGDLFFWTDYDMVCATSHQAVMSLLKDRRLGREAPPEFAPEIAPHTKPFYDVEAHSMLELEPPRHTGLRGLVLRAFTSRRIKELGPEIETLCHDLIDRFPTDQPFDLIHSYARIIPVVIICRLLGVPESRMEDLLTWSNDMVAMYQAKRTRKIEETAAASTLAFSAFLTEYIAEKRKAPTNDLLSELIAAEEDGAKLTQEELITTCILLLNAGHEATVHTIGNGVATLLTQDHRAIDAQCVEEILRFDPPLHMFTRWVYEDVTLFDHNFKRGDQVACLLAAANRDPAAFEAPARFDPARKGSANTSFGGGIHFCVGAPLARLELVIALQILMERCPTLSLSETPQYADVYHFHGLERLMVRL